MIQTEDIFDKNILKVSNNICSNIAKRAEIADDGLLAQNVISQLRNYVEAIILKVYSTNHNTSFNHEETKKAVKYIKSNSKYSFLNRFHKKLQITNSHILPGSDSAIRLLYMYYDYLIDCREFLVHNFNLDTLYNLEDLPIEDDNVIKEYHEKIAQAIEREAATRIKNQCVLRFYIYKKKRFIYNGKKYYELTLVEAGIKVSKFDRIIAFTKENLPTDYAINLYIKTSKINIINYEMPVNIITAGYVSIRPCELNRFLEILDIKAIISTKDLEYRKLMNYLSYNHANLTEFLELDDEDFYELKNYLCQGVKKVVIFEGIEKCRSLKGQPGYNVLTYLLYHLNNSVLKKQNREVPNNLLSNLYLKNQCIPFDEMPFSSNLCNHITNLFDLLSCIDFSGRDYELLGRMIRNNTEINAQLYTSVDDLVGFKNIENLINEYNSHLYYKHKNENCLKLENGYVYLSKYENDTALIISTLLTMSKDKTQDYSENVKRWLMTSAYTIDDNYKKNILLSLFSQSKVALIYGSAGTGKTTMIKHIANFFRDSKKVFLANTHSAVENLRRNIGFNNKNTFSTIKGYRYKYDYPCDVLFVDECSTVSNEDMRKVLKLSYKFLVLVGDIYQIESINFGNWFYIAKTTMPSYSIFELTNVYRSNNDTLLKLWDYVRALNPEVSDYLELNNISSSIDDSVFNKEENDEIILCLNYDGFYGINNLNKLLQDRHSGKCIEYGLEKYKVGDPIVFKENERFKNFLYNNLKGTIVDINEIDNYIVFKIEIDMVLEQYQIEGEDFYLDEDDSIHKDKSVIHFSIYKTNDNNDDEDKSEESIIPFQVAYAVSIHKAQGLEYDSVKIVITDEISERISHNIFYTAITRARKKLKIYWSKETQKKILSNMKPLNNGKDASILLNKFNNFVIDCE